MSLDLKPFDGLKIAIVHDWLTGYRGGEKVLAAICELFPNAPLHTLVYEKGSTTPTIENRKIHTSFLQSLPNPARFYRHYLPLFPLAAETLGTKKYDLIISTSSAVAKSVPKGSAKHWCYIHSPMRYVWDRFDDYFGKEKVGWLPSNLLFKPVASALRSYDKATSSRVDTFVSNSNFVAKRVMDYYGREAETIYPPVELDRFSEKNRAAEDFYLYFSALVPYKKADHAIKACVELKKKLVIVGDGPERKYLESISDPEFIDFRGRVSDDEIVKLYSQAKALLFPGVEDLGIVPIEASASGLPVIGFRKGGLSETQTDKTCMFYDHQTVQDLKTTIVEFEKNPDRFLPTEMRSQAEKFSINKFKDSITKSLLHTISLD